MNLREHNRAALHEMLVGDFIRFTDGSFGRIAHIWSDGVQWSRGGSYHMFKDGYASFSGCLNPQLPNESLTRALDTKPGKFWHFADDRPGPDRGVYFELPNIAVWDCNVNDYVEFKIS